RRCWPWRSPLPGSFAARSRRRWSAPRSTPSGTTRVERSWSTWWMWQAGPGRSTVRTRGSACSQPRWACRRWFGARISNGGSGAWSRSGATPTRTARSPERSWGPSWGSRVFPSRGWGGCGTGTPSGRRPSRWYRSPQPVPSRAGRSRRASAAGPIPADELVGGRVVAELGLGRRLELWDDPAGERLAELDSPLIERVDVPDRPLREHLVLVQGDQAAEGPWVELVGQDRGGGPIAGEGPMGNEPLRNPLGAHLIARLAERERLGLREQVGHEQVVVAADRVRRSDEADQVARDQLGALMQELIVGMLPVGALRPPDHRTRLIRDELAVEVDRLAVGFHVELLEVGGEQLEVATVGDDQVGLRAEEGPVPGPQQTEEHREVALEGSRAEVLVELAKPLEHLPEP